MGAGLGSGRGRLDPDAGESGGALVAGADVEAAEAALGELRAAGWPAPEDPDDGDDPELGGRDQVADRLSDEVDWLRQCAAWLTQLTTGRYPPVVNLRPIADWPATCNRAVDSRGSPLCWSASPPMWTNWPAPVASRTSTARPCVRTRGPSGGVG
ncbi:hypothetical protein [Saccharopolyspora hattusasensis]|uniref:hypothetical protein n=1 Tax=Saccharopolyspora hattusasensis TaxID=1128679 RepID=UPI003D963005